MAAWRQNGASLLSGDAANPDRVMFATWDGSRWSTPAVAVDNIPGLVDLAVGYGDGTATIAYTRFLTPTGGITPTLQLFTATWDGSAWSAPQQLTDDDLGHTNPQVVYNTLNQPLLVWQAGDTLRLRNLTTGAEAGLTLDPDLVIDEFRLLQGPADNLAAVFSGQKAGQRDLFVAFYDAAHNAWGRPYRLTDDRHSEGYPALALDSAGRLLMAYAQTQITSEERTTTDLQTGETITYTLPVEGQTDLYTLSPPVRAGPGPGRADRLRHPPAARGRRHRQRPASGRVRGKKVCTYPATPVIDISALPAPPMIQTPLPVVVR